MVKKICFFMVLILASFACAVPTPEPPKRSFLTIEFMMSPSDMPPGWEVLHPAGSITRSTFKYGSLEVFEISFQAQTDFQRITAGQLVYQYASVAKAQREFNLSFKVAGEPPAGWEQWSPNADEFIVACHDYGGRGPTTCSWTARYDEFIIWFHTRVVPGYMSLDDMKTIVDKIDTKIADQLARDAKLSSTESAP